MLLTTVKHALSVSLYEGIIFLSYIKEKRIKKCQKKRYYTVQELQEILGVSRPTIYNLYAQAIPSLSQAQRIKQLSKEKQLSLEKMEEIMELCPDISKVTVERILTNLVKSGYIAKVGAGLSTGYVRI